MTMARRCIVVCAAVAAASPQGYFFPFLSLTHDGDKVIKTRSKFDRHCTKFAEMELRRHHGAAEDAFVKAVSPLCKEGVENKMCVAFLQDLWGVEPLKESPLHAISNTNSSKQQGSTSLAAWCQHVWDAFPQVLTTTTLPAPSDKAIKSPAPSDKAVKSLAMHHAKSAKASTKGASPQSHLKPKKAQQLKTTTVGKVKTTTTTTAVVTTTDAPKMTTTYTGLFFDAAAETALSNLENLGLGDSDAAKQLRKRLQAATPSLRGVAQAQPHVATVASTSTSTTTTASHVTTTTEATTTTSQAPRKRTMASHKSKVQQHHETMEQVLVHTRAQRLAQQAKEISNPDVDVALDELNGALGAADSLASNA